jgi:hypothetical protein
MPDNPWNPLAMFNFRRLQVCDAFASGPPLGGGYARIILATVQTPQA